MSAATVLLGGLSLYVGSAAVDLVELPTIVIAGQSDELPWQYAHERNAEVLTLCERAITADFVRGKVRSSHFVPEDFQDHGTQPLQFVLFDLATTAEVPPRSLMLPVPHEFGQDWVQRTNVRGNIGEIVVANLFMVRDWPELDAKSLAYYLGNVRPSPPRWFREGLLGKWGALSGLASYPEEMRLARLSAFAWDELEFVRDTLKADDTGRGLYPLVELFESPPPDDPELRKRWELQAALFCRWQIYSTEGQRKGGNAFWNWARQARKGPVEEAEFRRCFGIDYATAERRLKVYLKQVLGVPRDVPIRGYPREGDLKLRSATAEEVARLLGAYQWQEAKRRRESGEFDEAIRYEFAARRTFARGLSRTGGHPALHAGLGLLAYEAGCADEARLHLEQAFMGHGADERSLLALARLRFDEARIVAEGPGNRMSASQITHVLAPAFAARAQPPSSVELYRFIGEVWALSEFTPEAKYLNVLLEGVANFPHDLDLAYQVAELHHRFGHHEIARAVARQGSKLSGRSKHRARFDSLLAGLGPP